MKAKKALFLFGVALMAVMLMVTPQASAKKKAVLKKKNIKIEAGQKKKIAIKNKAKNKKYLFSSNKKKIASVNAKGVVKAKKKGKAVITVKEKNKKGSKKVRVVGKVKVKVTAVNKQDNTNNPTGGDGQSQPQNQNPVRRTEVRTLLSARLTGQRKR